MDGRPETCATSADNSAPWQLRLRAESTRRVLAVLIFILAIASATSASDRAAMLPNSYLDYHVHSTAELLLEVRSDSVVRDRYCRHFAMSDKETLTFLSSLHASALTEGGVYRVYGVTSLGSFHYHLQRLRKGEPVFSAGDGTPVLRMACGNPFLDPKYPTSPNLLHPTIGQDADLTDLPLDSPIEASPEVLTEDIPADAAPILALFPETPTLPLEPVLLGGFHPPLLLLGLTPIVLSHGGGGSGNHQPRFVTPEPCTSLLMAVALGAGLYRLRRSRRPTEATFGPEA